ncbi:MAG: lipid-A-disaccharide synthase [Chitinophagales bacterium]|nr:lipid-A-disaccharide synthase [Chitinophagales bacterium]
MRYFVLSGEISGDIHAARLVQALKHHDTSATFYGWGGDEMEQAGVSVSVRLEKLAFMGFWEVLKNIFTILNLFKQAKKSIQQLKPDAVILVDYPGFNLRMAKWAKKNGYTVIYYISPQIWAWKTSRVKIIRDYVDSMFCIFPFEQDFYRQHGVSVTYIGHPLAETLKDKAERRSVSTSERTTIALLPGSRKQEIMRGLPIMLAFAEKFPEHTFVVSGLKIFGEAFYRKMWRSNNVELRMNDSASILEQAAFAVVTSGTATLETALIGVPQVVVYKANPISFMLARWLIKVPYISIVNLIYGKQVVEELIQGAFNVDRLSATFRAFLAEEKHVDPYPHFFERLYLEDSTKKAASEIINLLLQKKKSK